MLHSMTIFYNKVILNFLYLDDSTCDINIDPTNSNQFIVWAIGGLGRTAFKHFINAKCKFFFIKSLITQNMVSDDFIVVCYSISIR